MLCQHFSIRWALEDTFTITRGMSNVAPHSAIVCDPPRSYSTERDPLCAPQRVFEPCSCGAARLGPLHGSCSSPAIEHQSHAALHRLVCSTRRIPLRRELVRCESFKALQKRDDRWTLHLALHDNMGAIAY